MALAGDLKVKGLSKEKDETCEPVVQLENEPEKSPLETMDTEDKRTNENETCDKTSFEVKQENLDSENCEMQTFNCDLCEKTSSTLKGLQKHKTRNHPVKKENSGSVRTSDQAAVFSCDLCDKTSTSKGGLQKHKIRNHSSVSDFTAKFD